MTKTGEEIACVVRLNTAKDALKSALEAAEKLDGSDARQQVRDAIGLVDDLIQRLEK